MFRSRLATFLVFALFGLAACGGGGGASEDDETVNSSEGNSETADTGSDGPAEENSNTDGADGGNVVTDENADESDQLTSPVESSEPNEPNEPNEPTEPTPIEPNEPIEPAPIEPDEPSRPSEPSEPNEPDEPTESAALLGAFVYSSDQGQATVLAPPSVNNFGSGAQFNDNFRSDPIYSPAIQVQSGTGFGAGVHVGFIAFTDYRTGFANGFDELAFKIKANEINLSAFEIKFFLPDNSRQYDLRLGGSKTTALANGWLQVSIPLSDFSSTLAQSDGFLLGPFERQPAAFSYLVTDIVFRHSEEGSVVGSGQTGSGGPANQDGGEQGNTHIDEGQTSDSDTDDGSDSIGNGDDVAEADDGSAQGAIKPLYNQNTPLEPLSSFVRGDGVIVTRFGDRGRDRHAKDNGPQDHYDHYLAHYWEYRTARIQFEDHTPNGESLIRATYITESELSSREFRLWFWGVTTSAQFHLNPMPKYLGRGTWDNDFQKLSSSGQQHMYQLDITTQWQNGGQFQNTLRAGMNMEFEISQFLRAPPAGARLNYYGTSFVYVVGEPGLSPFEWTRGENKPGGSNDGTPLPAKALLGGDGSLGYNYSAEPAGRFMQMATNLSHRNAQPFVQGRRVHHTNFVNGQHDERFDNPVWGEQIGKAGNRYINASCSGCHVRNGRALVAEVGDVLDKWVFKVGNSVGDAHPELGKVLQPVLAGGGVAEGEVRLAAWSELANGLRKPNYQFSHVVPPRFSARIAPQLVGLGLLEAVAEDDILALADPNDADGDGISGRASIVKDPTTGESRLGRFGYKASTFSVKHQAATALNTDIGVMTHMLPNPDCGNQQVNCDNSGAELSEQHVNQLVKYLSLLGVPARRNYTSTAGESIFERIGCSGCHRPKLRTSQFHPLAELRNQTIQPYTDLLLHDMGEGLADNLADGTASGREWRTAPLWGLGHARSVMLGDAKANDTVSQAQSPSDSNRIGYLHDGRARSIDEAIRWHGGEAEATKNAYVALSVTERRALQDFLNDL